MIGTWIDALMIATLMGVGLRSALFFGAAMLDRAGRPSVPGRARPSVTVVVPAHDEEAVVGATIRALAASDWPHLEIVVVDDGSTDATLERARAVDVPNLRVLSLSPNRGKAGALNHGIAESHGEIVVTVDADTLLAPDAIRRLVAGFDNPRVGAVSGNVKVGNRERWLGVWQSIEYVTGLNIDRRGQAWLGCVTTVPGAAGAYRRSALEAVGGFVGDTLTEDTDLTLTLLSAGWDVRYEDRAIAWTEAPSTARSLFRQRLRWLQGNLQCAWKHRRTLVGTAPWRLRLVGLPNLWFAHLGVYLLFPMSFLFLARALEWVSVPTLVLMSVAFYLADLGVSATAYAMDGERPRELLHAPFQRLVWPFFLWAVFATVLVRLARGDVGWTRAARTGALARGTAVGA
jgi:cellulose synthase/poly-beta-1,6-N-acetylglucosamine synthase-like glycosyltransferase